MVLLECSDLLLRAADRDLLRADLVLRSGWCVGLVGPNGSGKSTLLRALAGRAQASEGRVSRPPGVEVDLVEQDASPGQGVDLWSLARAQLGTIRALELELERAYHAALRDPDAGLRYADLLAAFERRGGFDADARLMRDLERVGLRPASWQRPAADASGGERQRARLVGALVAGADVLLLDEPSNHLDLAGRDWLVERLGAHPGAVLVASHDRALLRRACTHVATIDGGRITLRRGNYDRTTQALTDSARSDARRQTERAKRLAELDRMAADLARFGHRAAQVRRRRAGRERAALEAEAAAAAPSVARDHAAPARALAARGMGAGAPLLRARHLQIPGIVDDGAFDLASGQRVALVGPSGSGKSSLLAVVAGAAASTDPRAHLQWRDGTSVLYLDQVSRGLDPERSPRATLADWVSAAQAAGALAEAGVPHAAWDQPVATLSGGERARVALALLTVREADVLILDEPTNDLDLPGIEALEARLAASQAAIVIASHDEALVHTLGAEVVTVEAGALVRYRGGIDGYRRRSRRLEPGAGVGRGAVGDAFAVAPDARADAPADDAADAADDAAIDRERALAAAALEDPLRWSSRALERWQARREAADVALLDAWERRNTGPAPAPRFRTREAGVAVCADLEGDALRVALEGGPELVVRRVGTVAHLRPERVEDRVTVPWAWRALCHGAARLAIYLLPVEAVQVSSPVPLVGGPFERHDGDWWVARRGALERSEGWTQGSVVRPRRRGRRRSGRSARRGVDR
jgi:ATPase subunit of ABC transporter with duplicated ATPase domains